jgi:DNA repair photolyase
VSDPFQPVESTYKRSKEFLKIFAETKYPFIFSTKGKIIASSEYIDLLRNCNAVGQVSMLSPRYDKIERNAPPYTERITMLEKIIPVCKRVIVRLQPYTPDVFEDVISSLSRYADMGVYGVTVEGLKVWYAHKGLVKVAGDYTYPKAILESHYRKIRTESHKVGLKFFAGENRLRNLGDSLCCCGSEGLEGFKENKSNLNHYFFDELLFTDRMNEPGTGYCFKSLFQDTLSTQILKTKSFREMMEKFSKTKRALEIFGFDNAIKNI